MQRPTGVTILAVLTFVGAGLLVMVALVMFLSGAAESKMAAYPQFGMMVGIGGAIFGVVFLGFAALNIIMGMGLWKLQNWARILTLVLCGLSLVFNFITLLVALIHFQAFVFLGPVTSVIIQAWIVSYLLRPHVKQAFGATGL